MHQMRQEQIFPENLYTVQEKNVLQNSWSPVLRIIIGTVCVQNKHNGKRNGKFLAEKPIQLVSVSVLSDHSCFNESTLKEKRLKIVFYW